LGSFNTWMYGLSGIYERGPVSVQAAWTQTSRHRETLDPFGDNPSYLTLMQVDFNDAGEKAWLLGGSFDFATFGAAGLKAVLNYGNGHGAIDTKTGALLGSRNETDVKLSYALEKSSRLHGLSFGVEGSWLNQAGAAAQGRQLRVFANYDIPFGLR
jgi:predicted porin